MGNKVVKSKTLSNDRGRLSEIPEMDGCGNAFFFVFESIQLLLLFYE